MNRISIVALILFTGLKPALSQPDTLFLQRSLVFKEYMDLVKNRNIGYTAEKFNVSMAEAAIEVARIIPDPYFAFDWTENREKGTGSGHDYSSEIGANIELGGKRRARIDLARSESELTKAELADFFRNLRADAAIVYIDALKQKQIFSVGYNSYLNMKQLSEADSIRFQLGTIKKIDATQSKLEAGTLYNDLIHTATEWKNSLLQIALATGSAGSDTLLVPRGDLHNSCRVFSLDDLTMKALDNRADLVAARLNAKASRDALRLARKERMTDVGVRFGYSNSYIPGDFSQAASAITGGVEIPLKFSAFSKGQIKIAQAQIGKSEESYRLVEAQIKYELEQAWNLYYMHCRQVENFDKGLLAMASEVLKGKIYSYRRGESSLLEVLNAQRTFNDMQIAFYNSLYDRAAALINLERSAGIWDIDF